MVSLSRLSPRFQIVPLVSNYTSALHAGPITTDDELTAPSPAPLPQKNHILLGYFLVARNRPSFELVEARTRCTIAILRYRREFRSNFKKNQALQGAEYCTGFRSHVITSSCLFFHFFVLWWELPIAWTPFTAGLSSHEHSNWPAGACDRFHLDEVPTTSCSYTQHSPPPLIKRTWFKKWQMRRVKGRWW